MSAPTARHETRALLRAHLAAASAYRHLTRHCAVCHRLLRLAMEPGGDGERRAPGALPRPRRVPPDAKAPPDGPTRTKPGPKDPPRHDHRPDDSASGQWQARSWQASSGVTVVTERVFRPGYFTPPLQLVNLICAIARGWRAREDRSVRGCPTASGTLTHTPAQTRSQTHERPCRPPEANRPPGSGSTRPRGPTAGREAAQGTKKDRAGPGGVQRDRYDDTCRTQV